MWTNNEANDLSICNFDASQTQESLDSSPGNICNRVPLIMGEGNVVFHTHMRRINLHCK